MRIEVWDDDSVNDDLVGEGSFNLMKVYNSAGMRSENGNSLVIQSTSISSTRAAGPAESSFPSNCKA